MDHYSLIVISDDLSPVRIFQLRKVYIKRAMGVVALCALLFAGASWDYWRTRADNRELAGLRVVSAEQQEQIETFKRTLESANLELARVKDLERKVRELTQRARANLASHDHKNAANVIEIAAKLQKRVAQFMKEIKRAESRLFAVSLKIAENPSGVKDE